MSEAVAVRAGQEVAVPGEEELLAQLNAQQEDEFDDGDIVTPILKVGQPLTKEVTNGDAESGEFINTLTGEGLGDKINFIIAYYNKGRFAVDKSNRAFVAFTDAIPEAWADFEGEKSSKPFAAFVGSSFKEHPDAEEEFKRAVNAKEREWGSGPLVSTTYNYTGWVENPILAEEDEEPSWAPVRLSLKRTDTGAAKKINSLKRAVLRKAFWDKVFVLSTEKKEFAKGTAFLVKPSLGRSTSPEEKAMAVGLAQAVTQQRVSTNEDAVEDKATAPEDKGGLEV